eukprot:5873551-Pyramimonas_sp.AAC.1
MLVSYMTSARSAPALLQFLEPVGAAPHHLVRQLMRGHASSSVDRRGPHVRRHNFLSLIVGEGRNDEARTGFAFLRPHVVHRLETELLDHVRLARPTVTLLGGRGGPCAGGRDATR